jgi:2'-5' RNA ligase
MSTKSYKEQAMSLVRAFIAIELPADILDRVGRLQTRVRQDVPPGLVRWVRPEGIHLTLKFLGDVEQSRLPEIEHALGESCGLHAPFELQIGGMGCFPNPRRPRVVWLGVQDDRDALIRVQRDVERTIAPLGFPTDRRGFHPHLTLGRVKNARPTAHKKAEWEALGAYTTRARVHVGQMPVDTIYLKRSELLPSGAVYSTLAQCPLGTRASQAGHG